MPRFRAIIFDLLTALLDSWTLWGDIAGDDEGATAAGGSPLAVIETLDPLPGLVR